jgi:hypothetical protein
MQWLRKIRIGLLHATYHRWLRRAEVAQESKDLEQFKQAIYKAEDAWRKIVIISNKIKTKQNG